VYSHATSPKVWTFYTLHELKKSTTLGENSALDITVDLLYNTRNYHRQKEVLLMAKLTVQFNNKQTAMLNEMAKQEDTTNTEILRRGLATYRALRRETKNGERKVSITSQEDEVLKEFIFDL